jgi:hypothetical protein
LGGENSGVSVTRLAAVQKGDEGSQRRLSHLSRRARGPRSHEVSLCQMAAPLGYLAIVPVPVLAPAVLAGLSESQVAAREVQEARNGVVRDAQLSGHQIPIQNRSSKYASPVLRITESADSGHTDKWKAAALAELERQERNTRRETHRAKRRAKSSVHKTVAKRKERATKHARGFFSPPHVLRKPHSSDEGDDGGGGGAPAAAAAAR